MQENVAQVLNNVLLIGEPVKITSDADDAIFISEEVWPAMTETLKLLSIPGVRESVRSGMREPIADIITGLDW